MLTCFILTPIGLLLGCLIGYLMARRRYFGAFLGLKADNKAKILTPLAKRRAEAEGEAVVKLDFASLLANMELKWKLWMGHKHQKDLGIWINWIRTLLDKQGNTK